VSGQGCLELAQENRKKDYEIDKNNVVFYMAYVIIMCRGLIEFDRYSGIDYEYYIDSSNILGQCQPW
jgi:acyl-CoA thioesterase FadM